VGLFQFLLIITAFRNMSFTLKNKIRKISPQIYYRVSDDSDVCQVLSMLVNCLEGSLKKFPCISNIRKLFSGARHLTCIIVECNHHVIW